MSKKGYQDQKNRRLQLTITGLGVAVLLILLVPLLGVASAGVYGAHLENNSAFCASCHTEPETTYVDHMNAVHGGAAGVDLASYHAGAEQPVACIECHSGQGIPGRIDGLQIGARDLLSYWRGNYPQPAPLTRAIPDENCSKCHADIAQKNTFDNHFHVLLGRWQSIAGDKAATCVDCHSSHTEDGQAAVGFLNEPRTVAQCQGCHRVIGD